MAEAYLAWDLLIHQQRAWRINHGLERRLLRDAQNPFELPHDNFLTIFQN